MQPHSKNDSNYNNATSSTQAVAYLGFQKRAKFSLATSAHTKEGANQVFLFFNVKKKLAKGDGPMPTPPKYASGLKQGCHAIACRIIQRPHPYF